VPLGYTQGDMRSSLLLLLVLLAAPAFPQKKVSDDAIYDQVRRVLANDPDVKGGAMEVEVKDGVVTVKGKVDREKSRAKVDRLARKVKGVTGVNNQVKVEP
jgi:osmotically-inducible protein OsmY